MKRSARIFCLGLLLILYGKSVFGASFTHFSINHSVYEHGSDVFRISFAIRDEDGSTIDHNVLKDLELIYDPSNSGIAYNTDSIVFYTGKSFSGYYDSDKGEFAYSPETVVEYFGPVGNSLPNGEYLLSAVVDAPISGEQHIEIETNLNYTPVDLPIITYDTFSISNDSAGNFILKWDAPEGLNGTTHSRIHIGVYYQQAFLGEIYVRGVPTDLGRLFVPAEIVQQVEEWGGDYYEIELNIRTNDGVARSYSNRKVVTSLKINIIGDINNDNKIGLEEAINALQVVSGLKNP